MEIKGYEVYEYDDYIYVVGNSKIYYYKLHHDSLIKELLKKELSEADEDMIIRSICREENEVV